MKPHGISSVRHDRALLAALWLGWCALVIPYPAQARADALVGKPAPKFQLQGIYGEQYSLDQFKGHILVMQFGSSW